jgi:hypothetical protein
MFAALQDGAVDRSVAPCGNFRRDSTVGGRRCGSLVPTPVHRSRWTPLRTARTIVDMLWVFAVLASRRRCRLDENTYRGCGAASGLTLLLGARVDRAVELILGELAGDVLA